MANGFSLYNLSLWHGGNKNHLTEIHLKVRNGISYCRITGSYSPWPCLFECQGMWLLFFMVEIVLLFLVYMKYTLFWYFRSPRVYIVVWKIAFKLFWQRSYLWLLFNVSFNLTLSLVIHGLIFHTSQEQNFWEKMFCKYYACMLLWSVAVLYIFFCYFLFVILLVFSVYSLLFVFSSL